MNVHITEDEQVEALKKWWRENGVAIITGVVIGIGSIIGYWKWTEYREQQAVEASAVYSSFTRAITEDQNAEVEKYFAELIDEYGSTSYAVLARLHMARLAVDNSNLDKAIEYLRQAIKEDAHESLTHLARVRLARIYISRDEYGLAETLIKGIAAGGFEVQYAEIRGDIYRNKGDLAAAREQYTLALDSGILSGKRREYVQLKLSSIASEDGQNSDAAN